MYGSSGIYLCLQLTNSDGAGPYLRIGGKDSAGGTGTSTNVKITSGKTYWVNVKYDSAAYLSSLAVFDPSQFVCPGGKYGDYRIGRGRNGLLSVWPVRQLWKCDRRHHAKLVRSRVVRLDECGLPADSFGRH